MSIEVTTPDSQPALTFDRLHGARLVVAKDTTPPYATRVQVEVVEYALDGDGVTRHFKDGGTHTGSLVDFDTWLAEQVAAAANQAEVDRLTALALAVEDMIAELSTRLLGITAVGPSEQT